MKKTAAQGVVIVAVPQLFPTPPELADRMVALADIRPGQRVLEPSAGTGRIIDAIRRTAHGYAITAVELNCNMAQVSAMQLLAELSTLPSDLTVREWVAHSGLDPAHEISGSSVRKASRISRAGNRHLRRALYMPALVASRCDPYAKAFFENLLARNKARLQALIAVARKLLHAIYGIFRSGFKYEGAKLFPRITLS